MNLDQRLGIDGERKRNAGNQKLDLVGKILVEPDRLFPLPVRLARPPVTGQTACQLLPDVDFLRRNLVFIYNEQIVASNLFDGVVGIHLSD